MWDISRAAADRDFSMKTWRGLPAPGGAADHSAEIAAGEVRILVREYVGLHIAERCLRLVLDAVVERLDDIFLEMRSTRMGMRHGLALRVAVFGIGQAKHVHFDAARHQSYDGMHVLRYSRRRV